MLRLFKKQHPDLELSSDGLKCVSAMAEHLGEALVHSSCNMARHARKSTMIAKHVRAGLKSGMGIQVPFDIMDASISAADVAVAKFTAI